MKNTTGNEDIDNTKSSNGINVVAEMKRYLFKEPICTSTFCAKRTEWFNICNIHPSGATRRLKRHQNKVKVEGFCLKYLISSLIFYFFCGSMKKFNQFSIKKKKKKKSPKLSLLHKN